MPRLPLGDWVDSAVDWLQTHLSWLFDAISSVVTRHVRRHQTPYSPPPPRCSSRASSPSSPGGCAACSPGVLAFVGFALIDSVELWDEAMDTLTLVLVATIVTLVLAVPLGIWAARSKAVSAR